MRRREICKLTADLCDTNEHRETQEEYWNAIRAMDVERIEWFRSFAPVQGGRQSIMNVHAYRRATLYGFSGIAFDEHGWFVVPDWTTEEEISFKLPKENVIYNALQIVSSPNGKWQWGYSWQFGKSAGSGANANIYHEPFESREKCFVDALTSMEREFSDKVEGGYYKSDLAYLNRILEMVRAKMPKPESDSDGMQQWLNDYQKLRK